MGELLYGDLSREIIGAAFEVWRVLGYGFLEKVYDNALVVELEQKGLSVKQQSAIGVCYKGTVIGQYAADIFVENKIIVELKAEKENSPKHEAQLLNYLKATGIRVGLLFNVGEKKVPF